MPSFKAKCQLCSRRIDIGSYTGTFSLHNNKAGEVCPGSSREIPKVLLPKTKPPSQQTVAKRNRKSPEPSASLIAQFEVNQKNTIQKSLKEEREIRKASQEENASKSSVRSLNGGLPTLGKR